jgi:hypothetical protein
MFDSTVYSHENVSSQNCAFSGASTKVHQYQNANPQNRNFNRHFQLPLMLKRALFAIAMMKQTAVLSKKIFRD